MSTTHTFDARPAARLARLCLTDAELAEYGAQLAEIVAYVAKLDGVNVSHVGPMSHANPVFDVMRPDISRPGIGAENALANAPRRAHDQFSVPRVVE
jgi:aspartyl-tRNA(Asn)/glutamyl-tRNA(Gln) amidotransferase subunit C